MAALASIMGVIKEDRSLIPPEMPAMDSKNLSEQFPETRNCEFFRCLLPKGLLETWEEERVSCQEGSCGRCFLLSLKSRVQYTAACAICVPLEIALGVLGMGTGVCCCCGACFCGCCEGITSFCPGTCEIEEGEESSAENCCTLATALPAASSCCLFDSFLQTIRWPGNVLCPEAQNLCGQHRVDIPVMQVSAMLNDLIENPGGSTKNKEESRSFLS